MSQNSGGDEDFERFATTIYPNLVRFGFVLVGDRGHSEDLAQRALVKVFLRWNTITKKGSAGSYARTVMARDATKWRRRRWRGEQPTDFAHVGYDEPSEDAAHDVEATELLRKALMTLPMDQRAVIVIRYYAGLTEAEIAAALRIAPGTVKSRAARGLDALAGSGLLDAASVNESLR